MRRVNTDRELEMKIVECDITKSTGMFDPPAVMVKYEGSEEFVQLFTYYPDEISFSSSEFIGLTEEEGRQLKFKKDKAFLQS
jgi:hypothetical protein